MGDCLHIFPKCGPNLKLECQMFKRKKPIAEIPLTPAQWTHVMGRIFLGLLLFFSAAMVLSWGYNLYGHFFVVEDANRALEEGRVVDAFNKLEGGHLFSAVEAYHGFGEEQDAGLQEEVDALVSGGRDYLPKEQDFLKHHIAHFMAAFRTHKVEGSVSVVPGDGVVVESLWERVAAGVHSGMIFSAYLTLASLIFALLYYLFVVKGWISNLPSQQPPVNGQKRR